MSTTPQPTQATSTPAPISDDHPFPCACPECRVCDERITRLARSLSLRLRLRQIARQVEREAAADGAT